MNKKSFILLAAGKPHQGKEPALLTEVNGKSLFSWQLNNLSSHTIPQVVIGYAADKFKSLSNQAYFHENTEWESTNSTASLLCADLSAQSIVVSYADILFRPDLLQQLESSSSDITLVYDSVWQQRFIGRSKEDKVITAKVILSNDGQLLRVGQDLPVSWVNGEFIGLVHFQGAALNYVRELQKNHLDSVKNLSLSDFVELLRLQSFDINVIDIKGDWAELNEPQDIAHFILGTKAETLYRLSHLVKQSKVLDLVAFTVSEWQENANKCIQQITNAFNHHNIVVRSSAKSEDAFTQSNAGAYTSVLHVPLESNAIQQAVETVITSYVDCQPDDQVLVQPMLQDVWISGVAFTRTLEHGSPFYIINYDESGDTESITSGNSRQHKSLFFRKNASINSIEEKKLHPLLQAIQEVETVLNYDALDIEFAIDNAGTVYLLQARPIVAVNKEQQTQKEYVLDLQYAAEKKWQRLQYASPQIKGELGLFGVMPDWNPAEIIGVNPGKLAISLYQHLILNDVWAQQRAEYGYHDVRPQPLLRIFAGKPYIDIRASFNSFIPNDVSEPLAEKLVDFYLNWLKSHPYLHDKVEFDVVPTCFGPNFPKWEQRLAQHAHLSQEEIAQLKLGLRHITQQALFRTQSDLNSLKVLESRYQSVLHNKNLPHSEKIALLLENSKKYGTLPFSHLARSGFVAVTLLKEAVDVGWLSKEARDGFMESVETVSHELSVDAWHTAQGEKTWESFVQTYGHLRPGTYDITSPAYWDDPEHFLRPLIAHAIKPTPSKINLNYWLNEKNDFFEKLRNIGLIATNEEFETFLKNAIEGREKAKFIFTKSLSSALFLLAHEGEKLDLNLVQLSNLSYTDLQEAFVYDLPKSVIAKQLKDKANNNQHLRNISLACQLPPLLCSANDFSSFVLTEDKPNFIGNKRITAQAVRLDGTPETAPSVEGSIVLIPQADPGYDWLFGQKIAGLITMYGGANSHMAIRSAEFGLPAAIGVGIQLYNKLKLANTIELDPAGETIRVLY